MFPVWLDAVEKLKIVEFEGVRNILFTEAKMPAPPDGIQCNLIPNGRCSRLLVSFRCFFSSKHNTGIERSLVEAPHPWLRGKTRAGADADVALAGSGSRVLVLVFPKRSGFQG